MTYDNLKSKWKQINEEIQSNEFSLLLEQIFTKRNVKFIPRTRKKYITEENKDAELGAPTPEEMNDIRGVSKQAPPPTDDSSGNNTQQQNQTGDNKNDNQDVKSGGQDQAGDNKSGESKSGENQKGAGEDNKQDQGKAIVEPIPEDKLREFQKKNAEIIRIVYDRSGNGIPETSPEKIQQFAEFRVSPEGSEIDKEIINTITVLSKNIPTSDHNKFVDEAFNILKSKATKTGGFPKNAQTVKGYLSEILPILNQIGLMKNVKENEKNAYAIYLAFVFASGYNFIHAGSHGAVGNVKEAIDSSKGDASKFFETVLSLSKELPQDEFVEQVVDYLNNNYAFENVDEMHKNFRTYISNVYKLRSMMAKIKKQTKIIQKILNTQN